MARFVALNPTSYAERRAFLVHVAMSVLTGEVDTDVAFAHNSTVGNGNSYLQSPTTFDSRILASNGNDKLLLGVSYDDIESRIPIEGKAVAGNLILICRSELDSEENNWTSNNSNVQDMASLMDSICSEWDINWLQGVQKLTGDAVGVTINNQQQFVAIGVLKETQTEDYNPLDLLPVGDVGQYIMINPNKVISLLQ